MNPSMVPSKDYVVPWFGARKGLGNICCSAQPD